MEDQVHISNPIIPADFPDPEVIRVENDYYLISTTMHMFPGGVILHSRDLLRWSYAGTVFDRLDLTPAQCLQNGQNIYGQGMWAATLRYHQGRFYVIFVANDTHQTYLFSASQISGPWHKTILPGFYHDCSLLFDDDGRVYLVYGNTDIHLTELKADLSGPKPQGLDRIIIQDDPHNFKLGYEGAHFQKIRGKYYVSLIHWPRQGRQRRTQAIFVSDRPDGEFHGQDVFDDDLGYHNCGLAQGGLIDTPDGRWFALLFQDHGAAGRMPCLVPVSWDNDFPVLGIDGKAPHGFALSQDLSMTASDPAAELYGSDDFVYPEGSTSLKPFWQWNHTPDPAFWSVSARPSHYRIKTQGQGDNSFLAARNTLTQRLFLTKPVVTVTVDPQALRPGDSAGLGLLQGDYAWIGLTCYEHGLKIELRRRSREDWQYEAELNGDTAVPEALAGSLNWPDKPLSLRLSADFSPGIDSCRFSYQDLRGQWMRLGPVHTLYYRLDHFMGARAALFCFSRSEPGGWADFSQFTYTLHD
ncbi:MAG: glycoside hydrolase 43 family protein [Oscillospiraceae bacterium]|nr:glycoside hydrolase 43 family protein [Oscillospiraceae bacterium]MDD4369256.1 glycoside hydrolase 43 family protein [Oscillospiraceae bacterium]